MHEPWISKIVKESFGVKPSRPAFLQFDTHADISQKGPTFHDADDIQAIRKALSDDGCVFVDGCGGSLSLVRLSAQLGRIAKPRNEVGAGTGVSNTRYAPGIEGKGYSSDGWHIHTQLLAKQTTMTLTWCADPFFHTDRSGWDSPPGLLITTLKVKSETGGEALLVDGLEVIEAIKAQDTNLYDLITKPRYSSFRADDGTFIPRPLFDAKTGILRFRFDDGVQLSASLIEALPVLRGAHLRVRPPGFLRTRPVLYRRQPPLPSRTHLLHGRPRTPPHARLPPSSRPHQTDLLRRRRHALPLRGPQYIRGISYLYIIPDFSLQPYSLKRLRKRGNKSVKLALPDGHNTMPVTRVPSSPSSLQVRCPQDATHHYGDILAGCIL